MVVNVTVFERLPALIEHTCMSRVGWRPLKRALTQVDRAPLNVDCTRHCPETLGDKGRPRQAVCRSASIHSSLLSEDIYQGSQLLTADSLGLSAWTQC